MYRQKKGVTKRKTEVYFQHVIGSYSITATIIPTYLDVTY